MAEQSDFQLQNSAQAIEYGREAVKTAITLNGGAAVAIVGFIGSKDVIPNPGTIQSALSWLSSGLICAFLAMAVGYAAQTLFASHNYNLGSGFKSSGKLAVWVSAVGIMLVSTSVICFLVGIYDTSRALFTP